MKRHTLIASLLAFHAALSSIAYVSAAEIKVFLKAGAYFEPGTFDPLPFPNFHEPVVVRYDVMMEVLSLAPGEDSFGSARFSFDIHTCACTLEPVAVGWENSTMIADTNGIAGGGTAPMFFYNHDLGVSDDDYQEIFVSLAPGAFTHPGDTRRSLGEVGSPDGTPVLLGSAYYELDLKQRGVATVRLNPLEVTAKLTDGSFVPATAVTTYGITHSFLIDCPEPSSVVMLGGMLAVVGLRRRVG